MNQGGNKCQAPGFSAQGTLPDLKKFGIHIKGPGIKIDHNALLTTHATGVDNGSQVFAVALDGDKIIVPDGTHPGCQLDFGM